MGATFAQPRVVINISESHEKKGKSRFFLWYRRQKRSIRRKILRHWLGMPNGWRAAITFAAGFLGIFLAYYLFLIACIYAFTYSFLAGMGVVFVFGLMLYGLFEVAI